MTVFARSDESVRRAAKLTFRLADHEALQGADLCVFAVPDHALAQVAQSLLADLGPTTALVHCAGAFDLTAFGSPAIVSGRPLGSFHPLCAISDPLDPLEGHSVALAANGRDLLALLTQMAVALGLKALEVPEARRAAYHAGAVMSAGLMVALASAATAALTEAGVEEGAALEALLGLMRSAIRGVEQRGLVRGSTGPVPRGDLAVVEAHLAALPAELREIYRSLSLRSLLLAKGQLPAETRHALERLLRRG